MLKAIELGQLLTKREMKDVKGGGTCCVHTTDWDEYDCGFSKQQAKNLQADTPDTKWCCDSC